MPLMHRFAQRFLDLFNPRLRRVAGLYGRAHGLGVDTTTLIFAATLAVNKHETRAIEILTDAIKRQHR